MTLSRKPYRAPAPYGSLKDACPTVKSLWFSRDADPELCEPFGMACDFTDDAESLKQAEFQQAVSVLVGCLNPIEEKVISYRYNHEMSLEEVGFVFNVTRERIRQIEGKAIRKMAREAIKNGLSLACLFGAGA